VIPADVLHALRALVDPGRIRLIGLLAARPSTADSLAAALHRPLPAVRRDLDVLADAGLVEARPAPGGEAFSARPDRIGALAAALAAHERDLAGEASPRGGAWPHEGEALEATEARLGLSPDERRFLRGYLVDGRLSTIPARGAKRAVVLRFLRERVFTEERSYPEREVNARLALFHPDVAALRRYLVDDGLVTRAGGHYRRVGDPPAATPAPAGTPAPSPASRSDSPSPASEG
jgi:DNA-binding transcriptional ArsR family regulator